MQPSSHTSRLVFFKCSIRSFWIQSEKFRSAVKDQLEATVDLLYIELASGYQRKCLMITETWSIQPGIFYLLTSFSEVLRKMPRIKSRIHYPRENAPLNHTQSLAYSFYANNFHSSLITANNHPAPTLPSVFITWETYLQANDSFPIFPRWALSVILCMIWEQLSHIAVL